MSTHPEVIPAEGGLMDPWVDLSTGRATFLPLFPRPKGKTMTNEEAGEMMAWLERLRAMVPA